MLEGNRCELCYEVIQSSKARHRQTKYCQECARQKKKENTGDSWTPEDRREYMRRYMSEYRRRHPKLSKPYVLKHRREKQKARISVHRTVTFYCLWFLPLLLLAPVSTETMSVWFDSLKTAIAYIELIVIKITGLVIVVTVCWKHIKHLFARDDKNADKDKESKENEN